LESLPQLHAGLIQAANNPSRSFGPVKCRRVLPNPVNRRHRTASWSKPRDDFRIAGKRMYLWRAVDHEGEILDVLLQRWRDRRAAVKLMRKLLRPWRQRVQLAENGRSGFTRE
jgi:hypothetical protein